MDYIDKILNLAEKELQLRNKAERKFIDNFKSLEYCNNSMYKAIIDSAYELAYIKDYDDESLIIKENNSFIVIIKGVDSYSCLLTEQIANDMSYIDMNDILSYMKNRVIQN